MIKINTPVTSGTTMQLNDSAYGGSGTGVTIGDYWTWPYHYQQPYYVPYPQYVYTNNEPEHCIGKAHVFDCEHAKSCKCGKVKRSNPDRMEK